MATSIAVPLPAKCLQSELDKLGGTVRAINRNTIAEKTRSLYLQAQKKMLTWFRSMVELESDKSVNENNETDSSSEIETSVNNGVKFTTLFDENELQLDRIEPSHFQLYLASLEKKGGEKPSFNSYSQARSALNSLFRDKGLPLPQTLADANEIFFRGLKRQHAQEKQLGIRKIEEGKSPIPFPFYKILAKYLMMRNTFAHLYLVITWNLMCRTDNTEDLMLLHHNWNEDSLQIYMGRMKNDQEGERLKDPKHVYANPLEPEICPLLGKYFIYLFIIYSFIIYLFIHFVPVIFHLYE